ncbi:MAG: hypothetical protein ACLS92_08855 [Gemmiger sp.]
MGKGADEDELTAALAGIGAGRAGRALPPQSTYLRTRFGTGGWRGTAPACALPDGVWAAPEDLARSRAECVSAYVKAK